MAKVAPLAGGIVHEVRHDIGEHVKGGEVLVVLYSADVASAQSDYLSAIVDLSTHWLALSIPSDRIGQVCLGGH